MKRRRATELLELVLRQAANTEWPNSLVESVYVYGSYARGALEPGDVDVAIALARDQRWAQHWAETFFDGHDPYSLLRSALRGGRRGIQFPWETVYNSRTVMFVFVYTQISPAISRLRRTISLDSSDVCLISARAADSA